MDTALLRRYLAVLAVVALVADCGPATTPPAPTATATPAPSAAPPSSTPTAGPTTTAVVTRVSLPIRESAGEPEVMVNYRDQPGGGLLVDVSTEKGTVLALLDAEGRVLAGWPLLLVGASGCRVTVSRTDGAVLALCGNDGSTPTTYAFDVAGRRLEGTQAPPPRGGVGAGDYSAIGPDGTRFTQEYDYEGDVTDIMATTLDDPRAGWPIRVPGSASAPAFGPDGRVYIVVDKKPTYSGDEVISDSASQVYSLTVDGRSVEGWPVEIPSDILRCSPDGAPVADPPMVAPDGSLRVVAFGEGTVAYAIEPTGRLREGWPYESKGRLVLGMTGSSSCPSGCGGGCGWPWALTPPRLGPDGTLYLAQHTGEDHLVGGNRIVAVGTNGQVLAGWPVTLALKGAWFFSFTVGDDGTVYAYAIEPAGTERGEYRETCTVFAGTIVALDGHGDPIYTTTIIAP